MPQEPSPPTTRALTATELIVLVNVCLGQFAVGADTRSVMAAVPILSQEFAVSIATIQWVVLAYQMTVLTLSLAVGRVGDALGRKPIYALGFGLFLFGEVFSSVAGSLPQLAIARVLVALGGTAILTTGRATLSAAISPERRGWALGLCTTAFQSGIFIGPPLTGFAIGWYGWRATFLSVSMPLALVGGILAVWFIGETVTKRSTKPFDFLGLAIFAAAVCSLVIGLHELSDTGPTPFVFALLAVFAVGSVVFWQVEQKVEAPILDPAIVRIGPVATGLAANALVNTGLTATVFLVPFFAKAILGYSEARVGSAFTALSVVAIFAAPVTGYLAGRIGHGLLRPLGCLVMAAGIFSLSYLTPAWSSAALATALASIGFGLVTFSTSNLYSILQVTPQDRLGAISGLSFSAVYVGHTFGVPLATILLVSGLGGAYDISLAGLSREPLVSIHAFQQAWALCAVLPLIGALASRTKAPPPVAAV